MVMNYDLKYIIVGDSFTGKTCVLSKYVNNVFYEDHSITIGVDCATKSIDYHGKKIKLQIWDTVGHEAYSSVVAPFYRGAMAALIFFDLTNRLSFNNLEYWINNVKQKSKSDIEIMIVGNKCDYCFERAVNIEDVMILLNKYNGIEYIETSAKTGHNITNLFDKMTDKIIKKFPEYLSSNSQILGSDLGKISLFNKEIEKKTHFCCS
jgi:small GTP-binding protein